MNTLGQLLYSLLQSGTKPVIYLMVGIAYVTGFYFILKGMVVIRNTQNNEQNRVLKGFLSIVAGAFLVALPDLLGVGVYTVFQSSAFDSNVFNPPSPGSIQNCTNQTDALTCVSSNIANNFIPVGVFAIFVLAFMAALYSLQSFLKDVSKASSSNQRETKPWHKLIYAVILGNFSLFSLSLGSTVLGSSTISATGFNSQSSLLQFNAPLGNAVLTQYQALISNLFIIFVFLGLIGLWHGLNVLLNPFNKQNSQHGVASGFAWVFAGIFLINFKASLGVILNQFYGTNFGL